MPQEPTPRQHTLTRSVAVMNQKGGVGKTTTTVNLAAGVARLGRSTLIVDLDPQAHASLHLGVDAEADGAPTIYDLLLDPEGPIDGAVRDARPNLSIIPAVVDLAAAETELADAPNRHGRLTRVLERLAGRFEFVFIDCPPSLGLLTLNALGASREALAPMQAHFLALQGLGKLFETVRLVGRGVNPRLRISGVVLCMHEETTNLAREVVADLHAFFEGARAEDVPWKSARVYTPPIRRNIKLAESPSFGKTIFEYAPGAPGAQDYAALAETFVREWDAMLARRAGGAGGSAAPEIVVPERADAARAEA
ncbi:MAG: ParA family protein [Phycisphaerales bacterium]|nr:MAG: ParA family protein [Phycisphaerales bacterium]